MLVLALFVSLFVAASSASPLFRPSSISDSPLSACYTTIGSHLFQGGDDYDHQDVTLSCPPGCLRTLLTNSTITPPQVWGSYPYHFNSSACLAAIHAGVIDSAAGGDLYVKRFRRNAWTNDSRDTVFPFGSSASSYSNGVLSMTVPDEWNPVPAGPYEQSATVTVPGGSYLFQSRVAPFSPRAGHSHVRPIIFVDDTTSEDVEFNWIIGGHNATHYLNVSPTLIAHSPPLSPAHSHIYWLYELFVTAALVVAGYLAGEER